MATIGAVARMSFVHVLTAALDTTLCVLFSCVCGHGNRYLRMMTLLPDEEVAAMAAARRARPDARGAQTTLALGFEAECDLVRCE